MQIFLQRDLVSSDFFIYLCSRKQQKLLIHMKMRSFFLMAGLLITALTTAQNAFLGEWVTVDDASGEQKSVVNIYQADNGMYYGQIVALFDDPNALCTECKDADHNQPIVGLTIVRDMQLVEGELRGGKVLDPENGKLYYAKIYLENGNLILRGSLDKRGLIGRSQTWIRK
jgi:uncharacterized protein (DUF2147 family)